MTLIPNLMSLFVTFFRSLDLSELGVRVRLGPLLARAGYISGRAERNSSLDVRINKHFEGSCELLSKQFDVLSISMISILQFAVNISLTLNVTL